MNHFEISGILKDGSKYINNFKTKSNRASRIYADMTRKLKIKRADFIEFHIQKL